MHTRMPNRFPLRVSLLQNPVLYLLSYQIELVKQILRKDRKVVDSMLKIVSSLFFSSLSNEKRSGKDLFQGLSYMAVLKGVSENRQVRSRISRLSLRVRSRRDLPMLEGI